MHVSIKRILAATLTAMTVLPLAVGLTSCGESTDNPADTHTDTTAEETASAEELLYADLPEGNFEGYEFNVLQYKEDTAATSTVLTERSGNPIEDKIYERALAVEERLQIRFVNHIMKLDEVTNALRNSIAGGLDEYDVCWTHSTTTVSNFLAPGYLIDLNSIEDFDFEKPWWDNTANDYLALDEHLYMAFGDINIYLFDFHSAILFNKEITDQHQINLYDAVKNGTWTADKFITLVTELALPADDGSGNYDRQGYAGNATATMFGFLHGADVELFSYDEEGVPYIEMVSEAYLDVLSKYSNLFKDTKLCNPRSGECVATFAEQKATFISCSVGQLGALREESFDYGVLPFPKYNEGQKEYISFVTNQIQPMVIPKSARNTARTGVILENLAAESYRRVRPEYFQVLLDSKYVRDHESMENMDMLFSSKTRFELEHIYAWSSFEETVVSALTGKADSFTSSVKSYTRMLNKCVEKTMKYLAKGAE